MAKARDTFPGAFVFFESRRRFFVYSFFYVFQVEIAIFQLLFVRLLDVISIYSYEFL